MTTRPQAVRKVKNKKPAFREEDGLQWEWLATAYSPAISQSQYHRRYGA